jgi:hypothetical protein
MEQEDGPTQAGGMNIDHAVFVDEKAGDPWRVLPILDDRGDGLPGCSFGCDDSDEAERRLREAGLSTSGVLKLQRDVELPDGTRTARFRSVHIRRDRTPEGILHTAEHLTPEYVHQPRYHGFFVRAEDACGAAVSFEEAQ